MWLHHNYLYFYLNNHRYAYMNTNSGKVKLDDYSNDLLEEFTGDPGTYTPIGPIILSMWEE